LTSYTIRGVYSQAAHTSHAKDVLSLAQEQLRSIKVIPQQLAAPHFAHCSKFTIAADLSTKNGRHQELTKRRSRAAGKQEQGDQQNKNKQNRAATRTRSRRSRRAPDQA
jgi:hypothetical protein